MASNMFLLWMNGMVQCASENLASLQSIIPGDCVQARHTGTALEVWESPHGDIYTITSIRVVQ